MRFPHWLTNKYRPKGSQYVKPQPKITRRTLVYPRTDDVFVYAPGGDCVAVHPRYIYFRHEVLAEAPVPGIKSRREARKPRASRRERRRIERAKPLYSDTIWDSQPGEGIPSQPDLEDLEFVDKLQRIMGEPELPKPGKTKEMVINDLPRLEKSLLESPVDFTVLIEEIPDSKPVKYELKVAPLGVCNPEYDMQIEYPKTDNFEGPLYSWWIPPAVLAERFPQFAQKRDRDLADIRAKTTREQRVKYDMHCIRKMLIDGDALWIRPMLELLITSGYSAEAVRIFESQ